MSWGAWWAWLLVLYVAGYAWGFRLMLLEARRAYANRGSSMWHVGSNQLDGMGAGFWALGVLFVPLAWPLLWLGRWAWSLIVRPGSQDRQPS